MIFAVIVPIFLLLALGYLTVKSQVLNKEQVGTVGAFVIKVALPLLFIQTICLSQHAKNRRHWQSSNERTGMDHFLT